MGIQTTVRAPGNLVLRELFQAAGVIANRLRLINRYCRKFFFYFFVFVFVLRLSILRLGC